MTQDPDAVSVELSDEERYMLLYGLRDWGGPAHCTESLAVAMGFSGIDELLDESERIITSIQAHQPLTVRDWTRALHSTELIFISDLVGTGSEWTVIHGQSDGYWIDVLRRLQHKVPTDRRHLGP